MIKLGSVLFVYRGVNMEIEVRILDINIEEMRDKLLKNNAVLVKKENQINKLFDFDDDKLLKSNAYARIRIIEDLILNKDFFYMTFKKRIQNENINYKIMDEQEIRISDAIVGEKIFESLGLKLTREVNKYRESYKLFNTLVEIDVNDKEFYPNPYIEIEGDSIEEIDKVVKILGYKTEDVTSKSIFEIIREQGRA